MTMRGTYALVSTED